ncbi:MAG: RnfABCDGE type electron transport complex subunit B [Candidatus Omnitrophica bacterium]|nr:RnfABCDGE type electron transport complex subunit B [Candidatus Omnitrophota bacterium]
MNRIILGILTLSGLGFGFGLLLAWMSKKFHVEVDHRIMKISEILPGVNCGACGLAGCSGFAEALVNNAVNINACVACSGENKKAILEILGVQADETSTDAGQIAVMHCGGGMKCKDRFLYRGLKDCLIAAQTIGGHKACKYGCLGQGNCVAVCPFGAIVISENKTPQISTQLCRGCKKCVAACPRKIISMMYVKKKVYIKCVSREKAADKARKCKASCIACGKCVKECSQGAIAINDNLAQINYETCVGCQKCVAVCPTKVIAVI